MDPDGVESERGRQILNMELTTLAQNREDEGDMLPVAPEPTLLPYVIFRKKHSHRL